MKRRRFFCYDLGMDPKDKIAIVTGASSGIGMAAARLLTAKGARDALSERWSFPHPPPCLTESQAVDNILVGG
jgi:NAD(P)-dependent dehydrogenase (short-subunit alcohol dehydrogenase family)